ncbi:LacI family transcriptional regulator [Asanoa ferruginea]|uniref:LacI family transcriptional regulator n=1 Tax=Asanoa ferruginea TaxID=53367 RepID=A0A3D9ZFG8_9ACTN|nr:LacI family DNA-binding transcriptional regulator [Asanoa ferruginea]REF96015.1 LacI family transcriptional regulator [Asanoa ferruginea]GIF48124.1 LacI family transcriptional regulator [Asanoa ferruginea]
MTTDGARLPTLEDVAQVAGVSRATVSRVINGIRNVNPELHEVVWNAVQATGYVPNRAARSLVTRRTGTIALVVSDAESHDDDPFMSRFFSDPFFGRVVGGLLSTLRPARMQLGLQLVGTDEARKRLVGDLRQGQADGAVVLSLHPDDTLPALLIDAGVPGVVIGRPATPVPISYVDVANDRGAALAAEHLAATGRRRLGMITGPAHVPASADRAAGFRTALTGFGAIPSVEGNFTHESGDAAMRRLIASHPDLDGVFVANDLMAQGALSVLRELGRRVPEEIAVVGFDDSSAALAARPPLTTVRQPLEDMAAESARLLIAHIDNPKLLPQTVIFEPTLVVRSSG